jgi:hypothetical protein
MVGSQELSWFRCWISAMLRSLMLSLLAVQNLIAQDTATVVARNSDETLIATETGIAEVENVTSSSPQEVQTAPPAVDPSKAAEEAKRLYRKKLPAPISRCFLTTILAI